MYVLFISVFAFDANEAWVAGSLQQCHHCATTFVNSSLGVFCFLLFFLYLL